MLPLPLKQEPLLHSTRGALVILARAWETWVLILPQLHLAVGPQTSHKPLPFLRGGHEWGDALLLLMFSELWGLG